MKIALIGPGMMNIPPDGWGAVEILIWRYKCSLEKLGHEVTIYNTQDLKSVVDDLHQKDYDFIHLHYDGYASYFSEHLNKPFCCTSHFGYILREELWPQINGEIFYETLKCPSILALSEDIKDIHLNKGYQGKIDFLRNGAEVNEFKFDFKSNGKAIVVGKIEPSNRKRQRDIANICAGRCEVDFVGPNHDPNFRHNTTCNYLGEWTKDELYQNLTKYSTLVLFSDCEAAPLVVPEAFAAGLSVVVSESASQNLHSALQWITILPDDDMPDNFPEIIKESIQKNEMYRPEIRDYAERHFDWDVIMEEYLEKIGVTI